MSATRPSLYRIALVQLAVLLFGLVTPHPVWAQQQTPASPAVAGHYIIVFRQGLRTPESLARIRQSGAAQVTIQAHLGTATIAGSPTAVRLITGDPAVEQVLPDIQVYAHRILRSRRLSADSGTVGTRSSSPAKPVSLDPPPPSSSNSEEGSTETGGSSSEATTPNQPTDTLEGADTFYRNSPQGWAVRAAGGYGMGVLGGTVPGPWNRTLGTGVRIAVLDSGVDSSHPDLAPNLGLNLSEVDSKAQFSPCDDGSPQDQEGHGTWVASLAAGAVGAGTGRVVGVAPAATILNIKVLQRMPGSGSTLATQCQAGQASGLVSWLLKGIDDAVAQHADVVVLSLGSIVDLYTGAGAGLKAAFDQVTHAAANAGVLIVAAAGNDGFDLSDSRYLELPAQARDVLAVTASTNPACAEDNLPDASCAAGAAALPYYANFGTPLQAVAAPGGNYPAGADEAISGWIRGACSSGKSGTTDGLPSDSTHSYGCFNLGHTAYVQAMGTSASAGLAAGAAALLRAAHPAWTPADVAAAMRSGSTVLKGGSILLDTASALNQ